MRKLVFMLRVHEAKGLVGQNQAKNLEISTHKGSRILIHGNRAEVLDVTDDDMTDNELLAWYKSRYSGYGMGISILHDTPKVEPVVKKEPLEAPVETNGILLQEEKQEESVNEEVIKEESVKQEESVEISKIEVPVSKVEPKSEPENLAGDIYVDTMTYEELLKFAEEHNIPIKSGRGRSEACVRKLVREWRASHD